LPDNAWEDVQARLKVYDKGQNDKKRKRDEFKKEEFDARTHRKTTRTVSNGDLVQPVNEDGSVNVDTLPQYLVETEEFDRENYDELRDDAGVALLCHATSVNPANLQVLDDGAGVHKKKQALMPAVNLKEVTIEGYIAHLKALTKRESFTLSKFVYKHPSFFGALEFVFRHWKDYYQMIPGFVLYVYIITNRNPVFPLFYQTRRNGGTVAPGCELLCKYKPSVELPVLPDACIQVTIGSDMNDRLGSSEFRLIRNNGDMATPIDTLLQL